MIDFAEVRLGEGRATECTRCLGETVREVVYRPTADIVADTSAAVSGGSDATPNVALTGPDPFGHPELASIVAAAVEMGVVRIRLDTDGAALADAAISGAALDAGVRHVRVTLLGGAGVHEVLADDPGSLEAAVEGARTFASVADAQGVAVAVTALVPVCRHNVRDVPAAVGVAIEAGASQVTLRIDDGGIDLRAALTWVTAACDTGAVNGVWVELEGVPMCALPDHALHAAATVRATSGSKGPGCDGCALGRWCPGASMGASAETLAALRPPPYAERLAAQVALVRGGERP